MRAAAGKRDFNDATVVYSRLWRFRAIRHRRRKACRRVPAKRNTDLSALKGSWFCFCRSCGARTSLAEAAQQSPRRTRPLHTQVRLKCRCKNRQYLQASRESCAGACDFARHHCQAGGRSAQRRFPEQLLFRCPADPGIGIRMALVWQLALGDRLKIGRHRTLHRPPGRVRIEPRDVWNDL